jgi:hypothetical protein
MVQIILLILGVIAIIRLPRLHKIRAADYPEVDPEGFRMWRGVELRAAYWLITATWGVLILQLIAGVVIGFVLVITRRTKDLQDAVTIATGVSIALFLALLVVAAIYGSKAKRLKEQANIRWPKKS